MIMVQAWMRQKIVQKVWTPDPENSLGLEQSALPKLARNGALHLGEIVWHLVSTHRSGE
jgi:hypothetical protein